MWWWLSAKGFISCGPMVPKSIVGPVDGAWPTIKAIINMEGLARATETVGVMRAVPDMTVAYAKERVLL